MVLLFTVFVERKKFFSVGFFFFEIGSGAYPLDPARGGGGSWFDSSFAFSIWDRIQIWVPE
jgi:hypothetical protein